MGKKLRKIWRIFSFFMDAATNYLSVISIAVAFFVYNVNIGDSRFSNLLLTIASYFISYGIIFITLLAILKISERFER